MRNAIRVLPLVLISCLFAGFSNPDPLPPFSGSYHLFKIERSRDPDIVMYDVNLDSKGNLDRSMPIKIYWIKKTEDNHFETLTGIQRKFSYGLSYKDISENRVVFQFASSLDRTFELIKCSDNYYRVFTDYYGKQVELKSLYVHFEDESFWFPSISKIDLFGIDSDDGNIIA